MATSQQQLVCDSSTLANFKQWAQAISAFFVTAGWTQSTDTGQVNWSTIASVPGSGAFIYEVWQPNDGLTNFYVKVEYGNISGVNSPCLRLTISASTNGAGTPTGYIVGPYTTQVNNFTPPSTTIQYECDFSGAAGRIGVMMWRNGINSCQQFFGIERSVNSSGTYTSSHVTLVVCGNGNNVQFVQQSLLFGVGPAPASPPVGSSRNSTNPLGGLIVRNASLATNAVSFAFNGTIPFDTISPMVGFFDYQLTMCGVCSQADVTEGVPFVTTLYGTSRTYMVSKNSNFGFGENNFSTALALCMRFD